MLRLIQPSPSIMATSAPCPQCGEPMDIKLVEPHPTVSEKEKHTFECREWSAKILLNIEADLTRA
jgi:hypothetical protein